MELYVEGIPKVGQVAPGLPMAWSKMTASGLGLVRVHVSGADPVVSACGLLNVETSTYVQPGYTPLHGAYRTNRAGVQAALNGVLFANKTSVPTSVCKLCQRADKDFGAMVSSLTTV